MKEFKDQIDWIARKKAEKLTHNNLKDLFKNAKILYNRMNVIMDAFQKRVFVTPQRPDVEVSSESSTDDEDGSIFASPREVTPRSVISDFNINDFSTHGLTDKELQIFRKRFGYENPEELEQALMKADTEEKKRAFKRPKYQASCFERSNWCFTHRIMLLKIFCTR